MGNTKDENQNLNSTIGREGWRPFKQWKKNGWGRFSSYSQKQAFWGIIQGGGGGQYSICVSSFSSGSKSQQRQKPCETLSLPMLPMLWDFKSANVENKTGKFI